MFRDVEGHAECRQIVNQDGHGQRAFELVTKGQKINLDNEQPRFTTGRATVGDIYLETASGNIYRLNPHGFMNVPGQFGEFWGSDWTVTNQKTGGQFLIDAQSIEGMGIEVGRSLKFPNGATTTAVTKILVVDASVDYSPRSSGDIQREDTLYSLFHKPVHCGCVDPEGHYRRGLEYGTPGQTVSLDERQIAEPPFKTVLVKDVFFETDAGILCRMEAGDWSQCQGQFRLFTGAPYKVTVVKSKGDPVAEEVSIEAGQIEHMRLRVGEQFTLPDGRKVCGKVTRIVVLDEKRYNQRVDGQGEVQSTLLPANFRIHIRRCGSAQKV